MFNFKKHHDYLGQWQKAMATGLMTGRPFSEETRKSYVTYVTKFLDIYGKVSYENLRDHLASLPVQQFSTKNQTHQAVISFAKLLIAEKALHSSFLDKARKIKPKRHIPPKRLTVKAEDLVHLIQCCKNPLDRLIIILLASTGLRVSEACSLLVGDVDFESRKIHVRKGKWGKARRVGITDGLVVALQEYLQQWRKGHAPQSSPLLLMGQEDLSSAMGFTGGSKSWSAGRTLKSHPTLSGGLLSRLTWPMGFRWFISRLLAAIRTSRQLDPIARQRRMK